MHLSRLSVLSDSEIERIHAQSLAIIERAGVRVMDAECRSLLVRSGARVEGERVHLPAAMVEEYRALAPAEFNLYRADGSPLRIGTDTRVFGSLVIDPWIIDYHTQTPRPPRMADLIRHTRLGEALPTVGFMYRMDMPPEDVPGEAAYIRTLEAFACNTTKPMLGAPATLDTLRAWLELSDILTGGRTDAPRITLGAPVTTPLTLAPLNYTILKEAVRAGMPFCAQTEPIAGATAPYSFAGDLLLGNAENLFLLVLSQVLKSGAAFAYSNGNALTDMANGRVIFYNADKVLWKIAGAQMAGFYCIPIEAECTGSLVGRHDTQNGIELALLMLPAILCDGGMFNGFGSCYNACGLSAEMIVMDADLADLLEGISAGINTSDEMLNLESIIDVGPGGHFLQEPFTLDHLRSGEFYTAGSFDRTGEQSNNRPEDSMLARAHERVEELSAKEPDVPGEMVEAVRRWAAKAVR